MTSTCPTNHGSWTSTRITGSFAFGYLKPGEYLTSLVTPNTPSHDASRPPSPLVALLARDRAYPPHQSSMSSPSIRLSDYQTWRSIGPTGGRASGLPDKPSGVRKMRLSKARLRITLLRSLIFGSVEVPARHLPIERHDLLQHTLLGRLSSKEIPLVQQTSPVCSAVVVI